MSQPVTNLRGSNKTSEPLVACSGKDCEKLTSALLGTTLPNGKLLCRTCMNRRLRLVRG